MSVEPHFGWTVVAAHGCGAQCRSRKQGLDITNLNFGRSSRGRMAEPVLETGRRKVAIASLAPGEPFGQRGGECLDPVRTPIQRKHSRAMRKSRRDMLGDSKSCEGGRHAFALVQGMRCSREWPAATGPGTQDYEHNVPHERGRSSLGSARTTGTGHLVFVIHYKRNTYPTSETALDFTDGLIMLRPSRSIFEGRSHEASCERGAGGHLRVR
jgi:hypothetical protein